MLRAYGPADIKDTAERLGWWQEHTAEFMARAEDRLARQAFEMIMAARDPELPRPVGGGAPTPVICLGRLDNAAVNNTFTTAQSIVSASATPGPAAASSALGPFSPDYFHTTGAHWRQEASGVISTTVTPTIAFGTYFGVLASTITTVLNITPTITTASGLANINWYWLAIGRTVLSASSNSTTLCTGYLFGNIEVLAASTAGEPIQYAVNATPPTAVVTDFSSLVYIDLKATWGTSSASNTITTNSYTLTSLTA